MRWKAYVYGSIILWIFLFIVTAVMMEKQNGSGLYLLWKALNELGATFIFLIAGLGVVLDHRDLLKWSGEHLNWRPPTWSFLMFGWFVLLASLVLLALSITDLLILLGILPYQYDPNSPV